MRGRLSGWGDRREKRREKTRARRGEEGRERRGVLTNVLALAIVLYTYYLLLSSPLLLTTWWLRCGDAVALPSKICCFQIFGISLLLQYHLFIFLI